MKRMLLRFAVLPGLLCLALLGCSGKGESLTGVVTLDGKALADAELEFAPLDPQTVKGSDVARTDSEGKFTVEPHKGKVGLKPGKYVVYIAKWVNAKTDQPPPPEELEMEKAAGTLKNIVPLKYSNKEEAAVLTVEIKPGKNGPVTFELKSQ